MPATWIRCGPALVAARESLSDLGGRTVLAVPDVEDTFPKGGDSANKNAAPISLPGG